MWSRARHLLMVVSAVIMLSASTPVNAQINTDQVMRVGQNALYFDDYMVAIRYFNQVISAKPYMAQPYFYRAIAKISLDDFAGAEADASTAIDKNPFITDAYEVRGVARQNLGKTIDAINDYTRVLVDKPDSRSVLYNLALARVDIGDYDKAQETFGTLISRFPRYDGGYSARAKLNLCKGDTTAALADINRAIELNANAVNAYVMRAEIAMAHDEMKEALADMDMAVKLLPQSPGMYINRAFLRYCTDDYIGAMADYDQALSLDPVNIIALYNRGLLRAEVHDYNNAITDFSAVLMRNPAQYRALFNRANLYREIGDWDNAYNDINAVIDRFPDFAAAIYLRGEIQYRRGKHKESDADYRKSIALARKKVEMLPDSDIGADRSEMNDTTGIFGESQEAVAERFSSLLRVEDMASTPKEFSGGSTRGHIQDTDFAIRLEPLYFLTYYAEPTELKLSTDFMREVDELNTSRTLPARLLVACHEPSLTDEEFNARHKSIEYYNSYFSTHQPLPVDWFARGMDFMMLRDYDEAIGDFNRAAEASPRFAAALLMRAVARWKRMLASEAADQGKSTGKDAAMMHRAEVQSIVDDLDAVIALSPDMAVAWYDKGCILATEKDYQGALDAFSRAIRLRDDLGEAYYNRGYVNMMLGNKSDAFSDLSRAGQLGIAPAYNLIKRMSR